MEKRLSQIDMLECFSILFVVIYHSKIMPYDFLAEKSAVVYFDYLSLAILSVCVPLFFFANGYLLFNRELNLMKHTVRIGRRVIQTGVWGVISLILLQRIKNEPLSFFDFLKALWTWKQGWINHLWFMGALVCIYIFFPVLKCAFENNKQIFVYFIVFCAVLTFGNKLLNAVAFWGLNSVLHIRELAGHSVATIENYNLFNMFNPFQGIYGYSFVYFCVGGLAPALEEKFVKSKGACRLSLGGICLMTLGLVLYGVYKTEVSGKYWDVVWYGYDTIFTFINVICIYVLCTNLADRKWNGGRIVRIVSENTIGIFFIHELFIHWSKEWVMLHLPFMCNVLGNVLYATAIVAASLAVALVIKKVPVMRELVK